MCSILKFLEPDSIKEQKAHFSLNAGHLNMKIKILHILQVPCFYGTFSRVSVTIWASEALLFST